ncbi:MAG: UDP-N-acetylglucosamine--N-acetylmuramyl-(pentapeptide) pyrophosphoryl-undecaprenol N-acetylglucosamine transferase [Phycisphaerales bacterium]
MNAPGAQRAFVFAGGGTGGHIFPALAIAEHIAALDPAAALSFVCSTREIDRSILSQERIAGQSASFTPLDARPFGLSPRTLTRFVLNWGASLRASRELLRRVKAGHARTMLVAMGGFVAAPMAQAARVEGVPIVLVNLDAVPGRANRWIAAKARSVVTSAPLATNARVGGGWTLVPPIVRAGAVCADSPGACRVALGLSPDRPTLLVTGASQGAGSINEFMIAFVGQRGDVMRSGGWQVIHQTGKAGEDAVRAAYEGAGIPARVAAFFREMGMVWRAADVAVSRSGAGSVAEAWANAVPSLFLPYPFHKDDHQRHNASSLLRAGAAHVETDFVTPEKNLERAGVTLESFLSRAELRESMKRGLATLGPADGAARVAAALLHEN